MNNEEMSKRLKHTLTIFKSMFNDLKENEKGKSREQILERMTILYGDITVLVTKAYDEGEREIYYTIQNLQLDVLDTIVNL